MLPHALAGNLEPTATNLIGILLGRNSQIVCPITFRLWIPNLSMLGKLPGDFWNIPAGVSALSFKGHSSTSVVNLKFKSYSVIVRYENAFSFGFWTNLFVFLHSHVIKDYFGPTRVSSFYVCIILIFVHHLNGCIVVEDVECFNTLSVSLNCSRTFLRATERAVSHIIRYKARNVATCFFCRFFFFSLTEYCPNVSETPPALMFMALTHQAPIPQHSKMSRTGLVIHNALGDHPSAAATPGNKERWCGGRSWIY